MSLILRAFQANGVGYAEGMRWLRMDRRRYLTEADVAALAWGLRCDASTLGPSLVLLERGSGGAWMHLSGHRLSPWVAPGKMLAKLCPQCLRLEGCTSVAWLTRAVPACRRHGYSMMRHCGSCGRLISWDRPGIDVCSCLRVFRQAKEAVPLEAEVQVWIDAVHAALASPQTEAPFACTTLPLAIRGMSVDGAFRLVEAFGLLESQWSAALAARAKERNFHDAGQVISRGLGRLRELEPPAKGFEVLLSCVHWPQVVCLAESAAAPADRAVALSLLEFQRSGRAKHGKGGASRIKAREAQLLLDLR